jgi:hypothetical protein
MRTILTITFTLICAVLNGQSFQFAYTTSGLGSNRGFPPDLSISIKDTVLKYDVYEETSKFKLYRKFKDTMREKKQVTYNTIITKSAIDSITYLLRGKEGKYVFVSNPSVLSGGIQILSFEYEGSCILYILKNTYDDTAMQIINILNRYLPLKSQIYLWREDIPEMLIKDCPNKISKTYAEVLMDEYDLLRQKNN